MVNSFGGQWFDMSWKPQLETKPWQDAITFYVDLLKKYGPPGSSANSFNEILALYNEGKCGMWIDATIAASFITDPKQSKVADKVAFAQGPYSVTPKGANWLWAWALAIPAGTKNADAAQKFITWATSKDYINLVAKEKGWAAVPTGTRKSTYANPEFLKAAKFAEAEKKAIDSANPNDSTLPKSPYVGVQFAAIPEFQAIGIAVGQQMSAALAGKVTVDAGAEGLADRRRARDEARAATTSRLARGLAASHPPTCRRGAPPRADAGSRRAAPAPDSRDAAMNRLLPRALMAPAVVTLFLWMIVPLVMTIYFSLVHYNLMQPGDKDVHRPRELRVLRHRPGLRPVGAATRWCCSAR